MKHVGSDKYTIAWFKLAECVARGEKERAMGVYRLLAHSFDDLALVRQLEGDLLLSFNDTIALEKYQEAAELYRKSQRLLEAAAIYEHLLDLEPEVERYRHMLLELYALMNLRQKRALHLFALVSSRCAQQQWEAAVEYARAMEKIISDKIQVGKAYEYIACAMMQAGCRLPLLVTLLQEVVVLWTDGNHEVLLAQFLSKVKALDAEMYELIIEEIKK